MQDFSITVYNSGSTRRSLSSLKQRLSNNLFASVYTRVVYKYHTNEANDLSHEISEQGLSLNETCFSGSKKDLRLLQRALSLKEMFL